MTRQTRVHERWAHLRFSGIGQLLAAPPGKGELRSAHRMQKKSDGSIVIEGRRFEVPNRYRHLARIEVRYASWDLSAVHLVDERTGISAGVQFFNARRFPFQNYGQSVDKDGNYIGDFTRPDYAPRVALS